MRSMKIEITTSTKHTEATAHVGVSFIERSYSRAAAMTINDRRNCEGDSRDGDEGNSTENLTSAPQKDAASITICLWICVKRGLVFYIRTKLG